MSPIFDQIGGAGAVGTAVDIFYEKVLGDPQLRGYFAGTDLALLKRHQRAFLTAALGGPDAYAGRAMGPAHAGLGVTDAAFDAVVGHLAATLTELSVPDDTIGEIAAALLPLRSEIVSAAAQPVTP
ncbi:MAG TPA: group 1 truncated hemoglobin [Acidimicrobiales bacterium]|jgi:hemoglobin